MPRHHRCAMPRHDRCPGLQSVGVSGRTSWSVNLMLTGAPGWAARLRCRAGRCCTWRCMLCMATSLQAFTTISRPFHDHLQPFTTIRHSRRRTGPCATRCLSGGIRLPPYAPRAAQPVLSIAYWNKSSRKTVAWPLSPLLEVPTARNGAPDRSSTQCCYALRPSPKGPGQGHRPSGANRSTCNAIADRRLVSASRPS